MELDGTVASLGRILRRNKKLDDFTNESFLPSFLPFQNPHRQEEGPREAANECVHGVCAGGSEIDLKVQFEFAEFGD